jgi:hypothetical protein
MSEYGNEDDIEVFSSVGDLLSDLENSISEYDSPVDFKNEFLKRGKASKFTESELESYWGNNKNRLRKKIKKSAESVKINIDSELAEDQEENKDQLDRLA